MRSEEFGTHVRVLRKQRKLTQSQLAQLIRVDKTWVSKIEHGELPHADVIAELHRELGGETELLDIAQRVRVHEVGLPRAAQSPATPSVLWGRDADLCRLRDATSVRVLTGPAGVGKTAMAVAWAQEAAGLPDEVVFVSLHGHTPGRAPVTPHDALGDAIAGLGVRDVPSTTGARESLWRTLLAHRRILLVLDDAVDASQVRPLLPGGRDNVVVITSRHRMSVLGIHSRVRHMPVRALSTESAVEMFADLLDVDAGSQRWQMEHVVESLDCLPLALRAAAEFAHVHSLGLTELVNAIDADRVGVVDGAADGDQCVSLPALWTESVRHLSLEARCELVRLAHHDLTLAAVGRERACAELIRENLLTITASGTGLAPLLASWVRSHQVGAGSGASDSASLFEEALELDSPRSMARASASAASKASAAA